MNYGDLTKEKGSDDDRMKQGMKVVILAGGLGTRLSEETDLTPKPRVAIGGKPILWHIMQICSAFGFNEFIICLGYKGYVIKEYFANYFLHMSNVTFDLAQNRMEIYQNFVEPWKVTLVDTGAETMTRGRVRRIQPYVGDETFMLTYGDGVADVDIQALLAFHRAHGKHATVTAAQPSGRFGALDLDGAGLVHSFQEKPAGDGAWINGGFFVMEPQVFNSICCGSRHLALDNLAAWRELSALQRRLRDRSDDCGAGHEGCRVRCAAAGSPDRQATAVGKQPLALRALDSPGIN